MRLGYGVPQAYIVPVERFCREMGPALGINLSEFEFPAYFNYFVRSCRVTLVVDSVDAEDNIRRVFGETLLGPAQFRDHSFPKPNEDEDFDPSFAKEARPNFYKEFYHFRTAEKSTNYQELTIDTLLEFCHFKGGSHGQGAHEKLGEPPILENPLPEEAPETRTLEKQASNRRHTLFKFDGEEINETLEEVADDTMNAAVVGEDDEITEEDDSFRRTMSDPDLRRSSKEVLSPGIDQPIAPPAESKHDNPSNTTHSKKTNDHRRGSMDSSGSFISRGGRSRDGMSWASGASFMLASDDEEDPSKSSWMYSQAKWLGKMHMPSDKLCGNWATFLNNFCINRRSRYNLSNKCDSRAKEK